MDFKDFMGKNTKSKLIRKTFGKGSTILFAEEKNDYVYFLIEGEAEAYIQSPKGSFANLYIYKKGSFFGEIEQFFEGRKPVEITALSECVVDQLHKNDFLQWLNDDFEATKHLIKEMANKLISNASLIEDVLLLSVKERALRSIAIHQHRNTLATLNKDQLAKEVNTPMRSLNRAIKVCVEEGVLGYRKGRITVIDDELINSYLHF